MFNLFSAISGKFSTTIITGTFFPVLLFLSCFVFLVQPVTPGFLTMPAPFRALDTQSLVLTLTFVLALLTGILGGVNHSLVRLFARAYLPGAAWFHNRQLRSFRGLRDNLDKFGYQQPAPDQQQASAAINPILTVLALNYAPEGRASSTRLGNIVANREGYFKARYGISHAVAWWRLQGAMDATFASVLDESKASFDFMLNSSVLALLTAIFLVVYFAVRPAGFWPFCWRAALFALLARLAYLSAVDRYEALGTLELAAIDLFRLNLLQKLGFKYDFHSLAEERAVWQSLDESLLTPDRSDGPAYQPVPASLPPPTSATTENGTLTILRSIRSFQPGRFPAAEIELLISDPAGKDHPSVKISDALPPSWAYIGGSAASSTGTLSVTASAPFSATLAPLAAGVTATITYRIQALRAGNL